MADEKPESTGLIEKTRRALGLKAEEVFASSEKDGVATIVTVGGHKVRVREGDKVERLHDFFAGRSMKAPEPPQAK